VAPAEPAPALETPKAPEPAPVDPAQGPAPADPAATPDTPAEMDPSGPKTMRSRPDEVPYKDPKAPEVKVEEPPPGSSPAQPLPKASPGDRPGFLRDSEVEAPDAPSPETPDPETPDAVTRDPVTRKMERGGAADKGAQVQVDPDADPMADTERGAQGAGDTEAPPESQDSVT